MCVIKSTVSVWLFKLRKSTFIFLKATFYFLSLSDIITFLFFSSVNECKKSGILDVKCPLSKRT